MSIRNRGEDPRFRAFRAQNRHFCALLAFETLIFGVFEHKIGVFVRFYPLTPPVFGHFEHKIGVFVLGQTGKLRRSTAQWRCCEALLALLDEGTVA